VTRGRSRNAVVASAAIAGAFALGVLLTSIARADAPPVEAFTTARFTDIVLSPDGTMLAMDELAPPNYRVVMLRIKDGQRLRTVSVDGSTKLRSLRWADDRTVLMSASVTLHRLGDNKAREKREVWRTVALDIDGGEPRTLLMDDDWERSGVTGATLEAVDIGKPGKVAMSTWDWSAARHRERTGTKMHDPRRDSGWTRNLYEVDLKSGRGVPIAFGTPYTSDWVVDADGAPVARSEWQADSRRYAVLASDGQRWKTIFELDSGETPWLAGLVADRRALVMIGKNASSREKAWALPLDGGAAYVLHEDPRGDVAGAITDVRRIVVGLRVVNGDVEVHWLDQKRRLQSEALEQAFPGKRVVTLDRSRNGRQVLVRVGAGAEPPVVYLVDFDRGAADIVGETYPGLVGARLGTVRSYSYAARDGASIPAFLTLPPGVVDAEDLPLVVLPHGGPEAHDTDDFDWFSQFLATRGYAVLRPQFRGSTGYGEAHRKAGQRQWGGVMQNDVTDGATHLVETGQVDPRRICIVGASYGGYAALAGAAFTPDLYACAISINGVSDLPTMLGESSRRFGDDSDELSYWRDHIGAPTDPLVIARSPARAAGNVRAPVLLLHAVQDTVVPILQSELMQRALTDAGKPHQFVRLDGEDHWLSRPATRRQVVTEVGQFLATHLKPASP
jgi:dipeptidyl aminopeptidase/acylaminoacyl peptidase